MSETQRSRTEKEVVAAKEKTARQISQLTKENADKQEEQLNANRQDKINRINDEHNVAAEKSATAYRHNENMLNKTLDAIVQVSKNTSEANTEVTRMRHVQPSINASTTSSHQANSSSPTSSPQRDRNDGPKNDIRSGLIVFAVVVAVFILAFLLKLLFK